MAYEDDDEDYEPDVIDEPDVRDIPDEPDVPDEPEPEVAPDQAPEPEVGAAPPADTWKPYEEPEEPPLQQYAAADIGIKSDAGPQKPAVKEDTWKPYDDPDADKPTAETWKRWVAPDDKPTAETWKPWVDPDADEEKFTRYDPNKPEAEGVLATIGRKLSHYAAPTAAAIGTGVLTAPAGPWVSIPAGIAAFMGVHAAQEKGLEVVGMSDIEQQRANARANPMSDIAADVLGAAIPFGVGPKVALAQRAIGAGIGTALEGYGQVRQGEFDPTRLAVAAGTGAVFNQPRAGTLAFERMVGAQAGRVTGRPDLYPAVDPTRQGGTPGPQSTAGAAEAQPPVPVDRSAVGDPHQERGIGSERRYPNPTNARPPEAGAGVAVGDLDPTLRSVFDAAKEPRNITEPGSGWRQQESTPQIDVAVRNALRAGEQPAAGSPREAIEQRMPGESVDGVLRQRAAAAMQRQDVLYGPRPGESQTTAAQRRGDEIRGPEPAAAPREPPIVQYRKDAVAIEQGLPPPSAGTTRLWRADRPGAEGTTFTNDLSGLALPFHAQYRGKLRYVDVPTANLVRFENKAGTATSAEFNLPPELARAAQRVTPLGAAGAGAPSGGRANPGDVGAPPAATRLRVRPAGDGQWNVVAADGAVLSRHPDAGAAVRAAHVVTESSVRAALASAAAKGRVLRPPPAGGGGGPPPGAPPPGTHPPGAPPPGTSPPPGPPPTAPRRAASAKDLEEGLWPTIQRFFMPGSRSESGKAGLAAYREGAGTTEQVKQQALARFTNTMYRADNAVSKMSPLEQRKLDNYAEGGPHLQTRGHAIHDPAYQPPAELRPVLAAVKRGYEDYKAELQRLPQHAQTEFIQNYLPHMYANPAQAQKFVGDWYGNRSGSLKQRSHPTMEDGIAAGLTPKPMGPIERFVRYSETVSGYISNAKTLNKLNSDGWLHWSRPQAIGASGAPEPLIKAAPPDGYMALKMPGAVDRMGRQAYAPRDMAETLNNLYDAGLRRNATAANVYDFALQTKNMWTAAELGLSPYHAFTMVGETLSSNVSRALSELASGDAKAAGKTLAKAFTSPYFDYGFGKRMIGVYTGKVQGTPQEQTIVDALKKANIKPVGLAHVGDYELASKLGSYATSYMRGSLQKEFQAAAKEIFGGNYKKGAMFVPEQVGRLMQTAMQPLFEHYIPAMKMAMASKDMASFLRLNPRATADELAAVGRRTADSMDNRFGEMVKDNLSMNKAFKDAAFVSMRSFAFTIGGPVREIAGGLRSGVAGALKGENRLSMTSKAYDPRVAYSIAFPLVTMGMASIVQYAMTGKWPTDWRDVVVPKTGGMIKSGQKDVEERVLLPGYHKDFLGYAYHPTRELWGKLAGPWQALYEQISGKDYKDQPIIPPKATWPETFKYRGQALLDKMTPIALQSLQEKNTPKLGSKIPTPARVIGFREPGSYIMNPNYEQTKAYFDQKAWQAKERFDNQDRINRGLEPLPPRQFAPATGAKNESALDMLDRVRGQQRGSADAALPGIRQMIKNGEVEKAVRQMQELGVPPGLQRYYIRTTINPAARMTPRAVQDFMRSATPEQREQFLQKLQAQ